MPPSPAESVGPKPLHRGDERHSRDGGKCADGQGGTTAMRSIGHGTPCQCHCIAFLGRQSAHEDGACALINWITGAGGRAAKSGAAAKTRVGMPPPPPPQRPPVTLIIRLMRAVVVEYERDEEKCGGGGSWGTREPCWERVRHEHSGGGGILLLPSPLAPMRQSYILTPDAASLASEGRPRDCVFI